MSALKQLETEFRLLPEEWAPRNDEERYRIYRRRAGKLELLATCDSAQGVGLTLVTLAEEGDYGQNDRIGVLDSLAQEELTGMWVVNPFARG